MQTITAHEHGEISRWENIVTKSGYGRYASEVEKKTILRVHSLVIKPTKALKIECEGGRWSKLLSDLEWKLICTDIDQYSLTICQKRIPEAMCIHVSPNESKLPCDVESIGLILCIEVEPVIHSDWFIDESFRVLQKGGLVLGVFSNRLSWRGLMYHSIGPFPPLRAKSSWYFYPLSYADWRESFCKRGFTLAYEEGYGWTPFRGYSNSPLVPVATRIERYLGLRKLVSLSPLIVFIARKDR
jgi:SAM-dependent methyltransferase